MVLPAGKKTPKQSQVLLLAFLALQNSKALISFSIFKSTVTLILCETARSTQSKNILKSSMLKKKISKKIINDFYTEFSESATPLKTNKELYLKKPSAQIKFDLTV